MQHVITYKVAGLKLTWVAKCQGIKIVTSGYLQSNKLEADCGCQVLRYIEHDN